MRAQAKQVRHEEEEESAFVSMTDMTVGFLFIMMILLAFFASQIRDPESVPRSEYEAVVAERDNFERDRDEWKARAETRALRIAELEALLERLRLERTELEKQISDLTAERDRLAQSLEVANDRISDLEQRIQELLEELTRKEARIKELEEQLAELEPVDRLEIYLARVARVREQVITQLRDAIREDFPDLQVELSEESDALRFQGEGLFASGSSNLTREKATIVSRLAQRLNEVLPCYPALPK